MHKLISTYEETHFIFFSYKGFWISSSKHALTLLLTLSIPLEMQHIKNKLSIPLIFIFLYNIKTKLEL